ncbi:MAG: apolipoprotein N-acyltransferase [Flavobacteriales bacterium CG_4_9_14_0_2_um_filter_35_242]|nr:apolipoprotein N-acyltransferase [Zetaproteobacteria bacterium]PIX05725.1 MAG: apolipoprotein N-acyltransferase [Flavobacteriales bacterium CG_4_8_14_3_um_filter_35_10]PJC59149.1 MAG: apolipoprotein N-acyltransferase [Flavobacteriales bacterium CG_4_9_14_0_2_um_filter_35_242]
MKKNLLLAILSGLLLGFSWPTYGFSLLLFIGFVPLLFVEKNLRNSAVKKKGLKIFGLSYISFLIFNAIATWWLWYATAFGMFFAIGVNALLMTLVFFIYHKVALKMSFGVSLFFLVIFWISFEKFHLNWDFSWPWLNLGNGFSLDHEWIQWYEYTGVFGGSLWILVVNIGIFTTLKNYFEIKNTTRLFKGLIFNLGIVILGIYSSLFIYHHYQINSNGRAQVLVIQPNVDPYNEKYNISNIETAQNLIAQVEKNIDSSTNFVIAPETTFSAPILQNTFTATPEYQLLENFTQSHQNINFVSGYTFYKRYKSGLQPTPSANKIRNSKDEWYDMYNAAAMINAGNNPPIYYKSKLVVGVELFPYQNILKPLLGESLINLGGSVSSLGTQKQRSVFAIKDVKLAPIICYESIYGDFVNDYVKNGAQFLAVITNDGWWQNSQGHKQHLMLSKLRAIENRRDLVRSANTGISAIINQQGALLQQLDYGTKGVLKASINLNKQLTFYNRYGDYIARISQFLSILLLLTTFLSRKKANFL